MSMSLEGRSSVGAEKTSILGSGITEEILRQYGIVDVDKGILEQVLLIKLKDEVYTEQFPTRCYSLVRPLTQVTLPPHIRGCSN